MGPAVGVTVKVHRSPKLALRWLSSEPSGAVRSLSALRGRRGLWEGVGHIGCVAEELS